MTPERFVELLEWLTGTPVKELSASEKELLGELLDDDGKELECSQLNELLLLANKDRVEEPFFIAFFCTAGSRCKVSTLHDGVARFQETAMLGTSLNMRIGREPWRPPRHCCSPDLRACAVVILIRERLVIVFGALWIGAAYALTVFLPVRSSLYALLPSIGSALIAGAIASAALRAPPRRCVSTGVALLVVVAALIPVYRSRNVRWVALAEVSERVMTTISGAVKGRSAAGRVVLVDAPGERFNLDSAFGSLFSQALTLRLGGSWSGEIVNIAAEKQRPDTIVFQLSRGSLVRRRSRRRQVAPTRHSVGAAAASQAFSNCG